MIQRPIVYDSKYQIESILGEKGNINIKNCGTR